MRRSYQFRLVPLILIFNFTQETASFNNLKLSYYQTKNRFHNRWKTSAVPVSFEVSEIRGALIDAIQNQNYRHLNETTQKLLSTSDVGEWDKDAFDDAESIIEAWSRRQSKKAALEVERLLRRIVKEQEAGNPNADTVDMTSLYSNLIIGWSNCIEVGSAERAEEILEYYQKVYEEHDNYDPLLCGPDANSFNAVIAGYARSTRPDAPEQAIRVLGKMYDWIGEGRTVVQPNKETYAHVLRAFAKKPSKTSAELIRKMLVHMDNLSEKYPSVKPDYNCHNVYIYALLEAMDRGYLCNDKGTLMAQEYLEQMMKSTDESVNPDIWSFNMVLNAWSKSSSPDLVDKAEALVSTLETYYDNNSRSTKTRPNSNTYNTLITCYSRSILPNRADLGYRQLQKMKNTTAQPDAVTYNIVMNLFAKSRHKTSAYVVEELLQEMTDTYFSTGNHKMKPTTRSINTCLDAWSKSGRRDADDHISKWLDRIRFSTEPLGPGIILIPDKWTFNAYLQALPRSMKPDIGTKAINILLEMESRHRTGCPNVKPDVLTFTSVLHCIALSGQENSVELAMSILGKMEDLHEKGFGDLRPNLFTYNCIINTIAKSKRPQKAELALDVLHRMEEVSLRPVTVSFNNVLNACAFSRHEEDKPDISLKIALDTLRLAQTGPGANWITYQTTIRVISSCVEDSDKRYQLTEDVFQQCCNDKQLTKTVMAQVRFAVSNEQYDRLDRQVTDSLTKRILDKYSKHAKLLMRNRGTRFVST